MSLKNKNRVAPLFVSGSILGLILTTGCNSTPGSTGEVAAQAATPTSNVSSPSTTPVSSTPTTTPANSSGSAPVVGESCTGDSSKTCLAIHFVTYLDSNKQPTANQNQTATIIHEMNKIWSQCGIGFQVEKYEAVDPTQYNLSYGSNSQNQTDQIRQTFKNPTNELLAVTTGPWGTSVNAWTSMPGESNYGAVMESGIVTYGDGIIYAHEFGHYLGLDHVSDESNLMNPVIYTSSTYLDSSQCQTARDSAKSYWSAMIRH